MQLTKGLALKVTAIVVGLALVAGVGLHLTRHDSMRLSAMFNDTTGLYVGNDVRVLGVNIGKVTAVKPSGTAVRVDMEFPSGTEIPSNADAAIMQSSLVTDRFVELTPAYRTGRLMPSGTLLPLSRTRNPANIDEMLRAVDQLIVALGDPGGGRNDIGQLLKVGARELGGQGTFIHDALKSTQGAMDTLNSNEPDLAKVTTNLDSLVGALADRDTMIRRLSTNVTQSTSMLAGQRVVLRQLVGELARLVTTVTTFVHRNRGDLRTTLSRSRSVLSTLAANQKDMANTLDLLPLVGQNIWQAYDPKTHRLRIRIDMRNTGPLSATARSQLCHAFGLPNCDALTNPDGTGALDPLFGELSGQFPSGIPGVTE